LLDSKSKHNVMLFVRPSVCPFVCPPSTTVYVE